jgi:large subunit ribosomal protein L10
MSKVIKQMEMASLKNTFQGVRDLVVLSVTGLSCQGDSSLRTALRKKKIRLQVIKNSLTRKVFDELGLKINADSPYWAGPTTVAWGSDSISQLSKDLEAELKNAKTAALYKDKVKIKGAIADGLPVTFEQGKSMPTRLEAIAKIIGLALSPGARIAGQIRGPASRVASQIKTVSEKKPEAEAAPAAAP